jgi:L-alanine-DL-glutamate epimerase-like enolase superfamily enzyme
MPWRGWRTPSVFRSARAKIYTPRLPKAQSNSKPAPGVHIDIPKSGGLLESKRIADLADTYSIWTAAHNPASPVGAIASAHAASSIRDFRIDELAKYID